MLSSENNDTIITQPELSHGFFDDPVLLLNMQPGYLIIAGKMEEFGVILNIETGAAFQHLGYEVGEIPINPFAVSQRPENYRPTDQ